MNEGWLGITPSLVSGGGAGGLTFKGAIDCSTDPNYPAGVVGDLWVVSVAGKIGGASGVDVSVGDEIICKNDNAGGDQATVGADWNIIPSYLTQATETLAGIAELATQAETDAGTDDQRIVTPLKLKNNIRAQYLSGTGSPDGSVTGYSGQTYLDTDSGIWYKCNSGTAWRAI